MLKYTHENQSVKMVYSRRKIELDESSAYEVILGHSYADLYVKCVVSVILNLTIELL